MTPPAPPPFCGAIASTAGAAAGMFAKTDFDSRVRAWRAPNETTIRIAAATPRAPIATRDGCHPRKLSTFERLGAGACSEAGAELTLHACVCAETARRSSATAWHVAQVARCAAMVSREA